MRSIKRNLNSFRKVYNEEGLKSAINSTYKYIRPSPTPSRRIKTNMVGYYRYLLISRKNRYEFSDANPFKIVYVKPKKIKKIQLPVENAFIKNDSRQRPHKYKNIGKVADSNWDLQTKSWNELDFHKGFIEHFVHNVPWKETKFNEKLLETCDFNKRWKNSRYEKLKGGNEKKLMKTLKKFDNLFNKIKKEGYKQTNFYDELTLNISRNGEFIHNNTASHRLSIAKILDIDSIPARILLRHKKWQEIREEISNKKNISELTSRAKKHQNHPDLQDLIKNLEN